QSVFQTACNRQICRNPLPPLWGRAGERAFSEWWQSFLIPSPPKYKPCGLLPSPTGERTGRLLGLRVL
ncbi:TPA: hypothetical protein ACE7HD_002253, partial [Neisseria gonorrhoeae]